MLAHIEISVSLTIRLHQKEFLSLFRRPWSKRSNTARLLVANEFCGFLRKVLIRRTLSPGIIEIHQRIPSKG